MSKSTTPTKPDQVQSIAEELLTLISLPQFKITATSPDADSVSLNLEIDPDTSGMMIGYHGETIAALQLLISLISHKKVGVWQRVIFNINDYRERREQNLREMALNAAERTKASGKEVVMPPMESFDRRIIHLTLADDPEVITESVGEGKDRRLVISPAPSQPTE